MADTKGHLRALACPLLRDQIDTDAFIPVSENTRLSSVGYADALFAAWRYRDIQTRTPDPDFILNQPPFDRARILICGRNAGCGSSRESAVWALRDYGFKAVLAISFNETFLRNCVSNQIWALAMAESDIAALAAEVFVRPAHPLAIDLRTRSVTATSRYAVEADPYYLHLFQEGVSEDELLARHAAEIEAVLSRR